MWLSPQKKYKVILLGSHQSGKSSFLHYYCNKDNTTIAPTKELKLYRTAVEDDLDKNNPLDQLLINCFSSQCEDAHVTFWDTPGLLKKQEEHTVYSRADCALIFFDLTYRYQWEVAKVFYDSLPAKTPAIFIGTRADGKGGDSRYAYNCELPQGIPIHKISSKTGEGVDKALLECFNTVGVKKKESSMIWQLPKTVEVSEDQKTTAKLQISTMIPEEAEVLKRIIPKLLISAKAEWFTDLPQYSTPTAKPTSIPTPKETQPPCMPPPEIHTPIKTAPRAAPPTCPATPASIMPTLISLQTALTNAMLVLPSATDNKSYIAADCRLISGMEEMLRGLVGRYEK